MDLATLAAVSRQDVFFSLAVLATVATLALLVVTVRTDWRSPPRARRDRRGGETSARDPREALALVGDTLAATHNPEALLPVILRATAEATGASAGRLVRSGRQTASVGSVPVEVTPLTLELASAGDEQILMLLYPARGGFDEAAERLAAWLASQASIALENARLHHVVQKQAVTDELTGLVNRRQFMTALHAETARPSRVRPPALILADLDDFKLVNDEFGHPIGDELLRAFAGALTEHVRDIDIPARLGGEEFAVLLPETSLEGAVAVAERLRRSLTVTPLLMGEGRPIRATASFGVAELSGSEGTDELLRRADAALYRAKDEGKNRVVVSETALT
jgi:diguanylate cyclase (GGDEF)-like protein